MKIAIVEDHLILSQSLKQNIEHAIAKAEVRLFTNAASFLESDFGQWRPEIVLLDVMLPDMDGLQVLEKGILLLEGKCKFLMVSSVTDAYTINKAMKKGAKGYVAKGAPLHELIDAIQVIKDGRQYVSQALKDDLLNFMFSDDPAIVELSPREADVLQRICAGRTPKEIAYDMKLSIHTIQQFIKNILRKFGLNRTADLIVFAIQRGLYKP
jgi:DNA-binding NarL/FixJ family response regulator